MLIQNSFVHKIQRFRSILRAATFFIPVLILSACHPDLSAIPPWDTSAKPAFVCPGQLVTLSWDTKTGSEYDVNVQIRSNPGSALGSGSYSSTTDTGTLLSGPISGHTTFTFDGSVERLAFGPYTHDVSTILPEREQQRYVTVPGNRTTCRGWLSVSLASGEFRSENIRVTFIANASGRYSIDLFVTFEGETTPRRIPLGPFEAVEFPPTSSKILAVSASRPDWLATHVIPGSCTTSGGDYPPDIELVVAMICEMSSASGAIVAATSESEAATPEPTSDTPAVFILPSGTPSSTPDNSSPSSEPGATFVKNGNCRRGPGAAYDVITSLATGEQVPVEGRNAESTWWWILLSGSGAHCWVAGSVVDLSGPYADVPVIAAPPLPTETTVVGCLVYDDTTPNNLTDTRCEPRACTPNDQPGGSCTP